MIFSDPNGAGKSTTAPHLLKDLLGVSEFVNADVVDQGLSAFATEAVDFQAGRIMLNFLPVGASRPFNSTPVKILPAGINTSLCLADWSEDCLASSAAGDAFSSLARQIMQKISERKIELEMIRQRRVADVNL